MVLPFKYKQRPWQPHVSHPSYPKWGAVPIPKHILKYQDGIPCLSTLHRNTVWFDTSQDAENYYGSQTYHADYQEACLDRAGHLRVFADWLEVESSKQMVGE